MIGHLYGIFGGDQWQALEKLYASENVSALKGLFDLLTQKNLANIAAKIRFEAGRLSTQPTYRRVHWLSQILLEKKLYHETTSIDSADWHSEFYLRMASNPGDLALWAGPKFSITLNDLSAKTNLVLLTRYMVLSIEELLKKKVTSKPGTFYAGWRWP
jgi:hypothetical protein